LRQSFQWSKAVGDSESLSATIWVAGSFCGKEKGVAILEELRAEYDFNKADDAIAFVEKVTTYLQHDSTTCAVRSREK
jgi:hypothetical protein